MQPWAVFDIDGTLLPDTSMEKIFMLEAIKKRKIPLLNVCYYFIRTILLSFNENSSEVFKKNKIYLRNLPVKEIEEFSERLVEKEIKPKIVAGAIEQIQFHREKEHKILLMSGSPSFLTQKLSGLFNPDYLISTIIDVRDEKYTGSIVSLHPYGERKTRLLKMHQNRLNIDFKKSYVYANHHSDEDHMLLFENPVAVNPTEKLLKAAQKRGWEVKYWQ